MVALATVTQTKQISAATVDAATPPAMVVRGRYSS
jgi:hypothetical protein